MLNFDEIRNELETLNTVIDAIYNENDMSKIEQHDIQLAHAQSKVFEICEFVKSAEKFELISKADADEVKAEIDEYYERLDNTSSYLQGLKKARSVYTKILLANDVKLG